MGKVATTTNKAIAAGQNWESLARAFMAQALANGAAQAVTTKAANANYAHGRGGLFSGMGRERPIISAMPLPISGLQSILPVRKTDTTDPLYDILTGVTETTGTEPADVCGTFPEAGFAKLCTHSFVLGMQGRSTKIYDLTRIGERINRGEFLDQNIIGNPFTNGNGQVMPNIPTGYNGQSLFGGGANSTSEENLMMFQFATAWARDFAKDIYDGNPVNNSGARRYFYGLKYLINAGYRDAETGVPCGAADSTLVNAGSQRIETNGAYYVKLISRMYSFFSYLSVQVGLAPATWVLAMPYALFYELTEIWPCAYMSYRCQTEGTTDITVDGTRLNDMRAEMRGNMNARTGQFLWIEGQKVPVVIDDGISESLGAGGTRTSEIFFVPMTVVGNTPVTYMEYFDFSAANAGFAFAQKMGLNNYKVSDDGRFFWTTPPSDGYCVRAQALTRSRLILLTPHLAGRLLNVSYAPLLANRSPFTNDPYFYNGGVTTRTGPNFYSPVA